MVKQRRRRKKNKKRKKQKGNGMIPFLASTASILPQLIKNYGEAKKMNPFRSR